MNRRVLLAFVAVFALAVGTATAQSNSKVRVACIGDSITYGAGLEDKATDAFPKVLGRMLGEDYEVRNYGFNSRTASLEGDYPYMTSDKYPFVKKWLPDVVTIMLGTNDSKPQNWNEEKFKKGLDRMIRDLKALPSHPKIIVLTPTPAGENPHGIRDSVIVNTIIPDTRAIAKHHWLDVVDLYTPFEEHRDLFPDNVHPGKVGAAAIAQIVYDEFKIDGLTGTPGTRILFIGDSITDGAWGRNDSRPSRERNHYDMNHVYGHGYMSQVAAHMLADYPERRYKFYNRGIGGGKLAGIEERWNEEVMAVRPDVISILVGINDCGKYTVEDFDFAGWEKTYRSLIDTTLSVNPKTRFALCTPFYGGPHPVCERLAEIVRSIAADYDCAQCVDFAAVIADLLANDTSSDRKYWLWDRVHPTYPAHLILAEEWMETMNL